MPTVHPHYTAVHMPHTGGTWLARVLTARGGEPRQHQHDPARQLHPHARDGRIIVGTIRDPWSWYASHYAFLTADSRYTNDLASWGQGSTDLVDVLNGWTRDRSGCPESPLSVDGKMARGDLIPGVGLWSSAVSWFYAVAESWGVDLLLDCAQLEPAARGLGLTGDMPGPVNTAEQKGRGYTVDGWSEEMCEWVDVADGALASSLGYSAPGVRAHSPIIEPDRWAA